MQSAPLIDLSERYWQFLRQEFPMTAIMAGDPPQSDILMREAPEDHERRAAWASAALEELEAVLAKGLSAKDKASLALLSSELTGMVELVATQGHLRPCIYPLGPEFMLNDWAYSTSLANVEAARRYVARLAQVPAALDSVKAAMSLGASRGIRYPKLIVERALGVLRGQATMPIERTPYFGPLAAVQARGPALANLIVEGRAVIAEKIVPAMVAYAEFIEQTLGPVAREDLACTNDLDGPEYYRYLIRNSTTTDMDAEQIHALGVSEVERITAQMLAVAGSAGFDDDLAGFQQRIQTDNQQISESGEALRQEIEILSKRIDGIIPRFFGHLPRTTYGVSSIAEEIAGAMPPAYAQANPADGSAAGVHWITSIPAKLPRYMHIPMALHEAWPGHLMHVALIQELKHLPAFRRNGSMRYSVCLEGWALYSEALGQDMGLYDSPEKKYGRLEMEMWRAVRLVVDTGIHAKGWSRERAIAYFQEHMVLPIETVESEVDRYVGLPGQALAYQLGNLKFRELRRRSEAALGERFDIREFHDALISPGAVTLDVLEQTIDGWIEAQLSQAA